MNGVRGQRQTVDREAIKLNHLISIIFVLHFQETLDRG